MDTTSAETRPAEPLPAMNVRTLGLMFVAGFVATVAFDLWGMQEINQYIYSILEILFQMSVSGRKLYILVYKFMVYI